MKIGKRSWKIWVGVMVVVLAIVGLTVIPAAMADDEATSPPPDTRCETFLAKVAANLGVTVDQLTTAVTNAEYAMLDEAVANGAITQEQADQIRERIQENGGNICGMGGFAFRGGPGRMEGPGPMGMGPGPMGFLKKAVANGVITQDQADQIAALAEEIRAQIEANCGLSEWLNNAVEKGIINQDQADQITALCDQIRNQSREQGGANGFSGRGFRGHHPGMGFGDCQSLPIQDEPEGGGYF
ncbi:MAG: hypothetical protein FJZ95_09470 [Chloroflexi bacterium]|nr:hypothetical protein [Chloroflexota bacterium]